MTKRQWNYALAFLLSLIILTGFLLPPLLSSSTGMGGVSFATPLPTSTLFKEPVVDVLDVMLPDTGDNSPENTVSNCTYPLHYWIDHPNSWPEVLVISSVTYDKALIKTLFDMREPDTTTRLIAHVYTAFLNILHGADLNVIEGTIIESSHWLSQNPAGTILSESNQRRGSTLAKILENYNNGLIGPGACPDVPPSPTLEPVVSEMPAETAEPAQAVPSATPLFFSWTASIYAHTYPSH